MSTGATGVVLVLVAAALLLVPQRPRIGRAPRRERRSGVRARPTSRAVAWAIVVAAAGLSLFPWWVALPAALLVGVALLALPARRSAAGRERERRLIAVHAELFASCLDAGMATGAALLAVSDVLAAPGPVGRSTPGPAPPARLGDAEQDQAGPLAGLDAVAAMLSLGADPATAWRAIDLDGDLAPLAAAALRSAAGGGVLAEAVREYAAQLRQDIAAESVRAAGRAGVLMTAPLGVCFLPAFLCLGLAPVVVGLLGQLQIF